ncbi:MAG: Zn-dependent protease [Bacteroidetes bacterium]|nr:Zn-dependent protease [Bacteroidota bacterium]
MKILFATLCVCFCCFSCDVTKNTSTCIILQPYDQFSKAELKYVQKQFQQFFPCVTIGESIPLPTQAYLAARNRYRADSLISLLAKKYFRDTVVIGFTNYDISTTKGDVTDWGVMGLGFRPGNACVVSTFRLTKKNRTEQLVKVALHEYGHTRGLPHCPETSCLMRDAEGGNPLDDEKDFCTNCKKLLRIKQDIN